MAAVDPQHRIQVDVVRDRLAHRVADSDGARVVHPAPDARVVSVRSRLRNAGICAIRPSRRRQSERLVIGEVAEEYGRRRPVQTRMAGGILGVARRIDERQPARLGGRVRIAVGVRQRESP